MNCGVLVPAVVSGCFQALFPYRPTMPAAAAATVPAPLEFCMVCFAFHHTDSGLWFDPRSGTLTPFAGPQSFMWRFRAGTFGFPGNVWESFIGSSEHRLDAELWLHATPMSAKRDTIPAALPGGNLSCAHPECSEFRWKAETLVDKPNAVRIFACVGDSTNSSGNGTGAVTDDSDGGAGVGDGDLATAGCSRGAHSTLDQWHMRTYIYIHMR